MPPVLIIDGCDARISTALRIRELAPDTAFSVMLADDFTNFSICGLPFYLSGEITDWGRLAHRNRDDISREGIRLLTRHTATAIKPRQKCVVAQTSVGQSVEILYDRLIVGIGAVSRRPPNSGSRPAGITRYITPERRPCA
jgi:NADPH-dependent 2,4-dienoyl-CoA reductase/sulfur reductase-like enzyme